MNLFQKIITFIIKNSVAITIVTLILCVLSFITIAKNLKVDNSIQIWFLDDDPIFKDYLTYQKEQGSDELLFLVINSSHVYAKSNIDLLNRLHTKIDDLNGVNSSFSIAKVEYPIYANKQLYFKKIIHENRSGKAIANLFNKLPNIRDNLISNDKTKSFFIIQLEPLQDLKLDKVLLHNKIRNVIDSEIKKYTISGGSILMDEINKSVATESGKFAVLVALAITILLLVFLPKPSYLFIALLVVLIPVILLFGLYIATGNKLNMISSLIPTIMMVYSVSDVIHIINIHYKNSHQKHYSTKNDLIINSLQQSLKPCFYTTITTVVGYLALCLSPLPAFKTTGLFTFIGLIFAFIFSYIITAIGFSLLKSKQLKPTKKFKLFAINKYLLQINYITTNYKKLIISVFAILFVFGIASIFNIKTNTNTLNLLPNGKVKDDLAKIENNLNGSVRMTLDVTSKDSTLLFSNAVLNKIEQFQYKIQKIKGISIPISIIEYKRFLEKKYNRIATNKKASAFKFEQENQSFYKMVSKDFKRISINVNTLSLSSSKIKIMLKSVRTEFQNIFNDTDLINLKINGYHSLYVRSHEHVITTQIRSFGAAFIASFLILFYFIKNFRTSFLALIPNLIPILLTIIVMVIFDINLEASNAMIAPIMIGIAMDDTIHLIHKYKTYKKQGFSVNESMDKAMLFTGNAVFSTTITLTLGFSVLLLSSLINMREFGLLCAITILFAFVADAILLPTLIKFFDK